MVDAGGATAGSILAGPNGVVVLGRTRRQLIVECIGPVVGTGLGLTVASLLPIGGFDLARIVGSLLAWLCVAAWFVPLTWVWIRGEHVELSPWGIVVVGRFRGRIAVPWTAVSWISQASLFGTRTMRVWTPTGPVKVYAPATGWWLWADPDFDSKATQVMNYWRTYWRPTPPTPVAPSLPW